LKLESFMDKPTSNLEEDLYTVATITKENGKALAVHMHLPEPVISMGTSRHGSGMDKELFATVKLEIYGLVYGSRTL
jgi:hypothetical protein